MPFVMNMYSNHQYTPTTTHVVAIPPNWRILVLCCGNPLPPPPPPRTSMYWEHAVSCDCSFWRCQQNTKSCCNIRHWLIMQNSTAYGYMNNLIANKKHFACMLYVYSITFQVINSCVKDKDVKSKHQDTFYAYLTFSDTSKIF